MQTLSYYSRSEIHGNDSFYRTKDTGSFSLKVFHLHSRAGNRGPVNSTRKKLATAKYVRICTGQRIKGFFGSRFDVPRRYDWQSSTEKNNDSEISARTSARSMRRRAVARKLGRNDAFPSNGDSTTETRTLRKKRPSLSTLLPNFSRKKKIRNGSRSSESRRRSTRTKLLAPSEQI